jgi:hypothetical protein
MDAVLVGGGSGGLVMEKTGGGSEKDDDLSDEVSTSKNTGLISNSRSIRGAL